MTNLLPFRNYDSLSRLMEPMSLNSLSSLRVPEADIIESEDDIRITMDIPGMEAQNISLETENNILTITGERREEVNSEKGKMHLSERRYGRFSRAFVLPMTANLEKVEASYEDGVLFVKVEKKEQAKKRKINIFPRKALEP